MKKIFFVLFSTPSFLVAMQPSSSASHEYQSQQPLQLVSQTEYDATHPYYRECKEIYETARKTLRESDYKNPFAISTLQSLAPFFHPARRPLLTAALKSEDYNVAYAQGIELVKINDADGMLATAALISSYKDKIGLLQDYPQELADAWALSLAQHAALPRLLPQQKDDVLQRAYQLREALNYIPRYEQIAQAHTDKKPVSAEKSALALVDEEVKRVGRAEIEFERENKVREEKKKSFSLMALAELQEGARQLLAAVSHGEVTMLFKQLRRLQTDIDAQKVAAEKAVAQREKAQKTLQVSLQDLKNTASSLLLADAQWHIKEVLQKSQVIIKDNEALCNEIVQKRRHQQDALKPQLAELKKVGAHVKAQLEKEEQSATDALLQLKKKAMQQPLSEARWQLINAYWHGDAKLLLKADQQQALALIEEMLPQVLGKKTSAQERDVLYTKLQSLTAAQVSDDVAQQMHCFLAKIVQRQLQEASLSQQEQLRNRVYHHLMSTKNTDPASVLTLIESAPSLKQRLTHCEQLLQKKVVLPETVRAQAFRLMQQTTQEGMKAQEKEAFLLFARYCQRYPEQLTAQLFQDYCAAVASCPTGCGVQFLSDNTLRELQARAVHTLKPAELYSAGTTLVAATTPEAQTYGRTLIVESARHNHIPAVWQALTYKQEVSVQELKRLVEEASTLVTTVDLAPHKEVVLSALEALNKETDKQRLSVCGNLLLISALNGIAHVCEKNEHMAVSIAQRLIRSQAAVKDELEAARRAIERYKDSQEGPEQCLLKVAHGMVYKIVQTQKDAEAFSYLLTLNGENTAELTAQLSRLLELPFNYQELQKHRVPQKLIAFAEKVQDPRVYFETVRFFEAHGDQFKANTFSTEKRKAYMAKVIQDNTTDIAFKRAVLEYCAARSDLYPQLLEIGDHWFNKAQGALTPEKTQFFIEVTDKIKQLAGKGYRPAKLFCHEWYKLLSAVNIMEPMAIDPTALFYEVWEFTRHENEGILNRYKETARIYMRDLIEESEAKEEPSSTKLDRYYRAMKMFMQDDSEYVLNLLEKSERLIMDRKAGDLKEVRTKHELVKDFEASVKQGYGWAHFALAKILSNRVILSQKQPEADRAFEVDGPLIENQLQRAQALYRQASRATYPYHPSKEDERVLRNIRECLSIYYVEQGKFAEAYQICKEDAAQGSPVGLYNCGSLLLDGLVHDTGVPISIIYKDAIDLLELAAKKGSVAAFDDLANICRYGYLHTTVSDHPLSMADRQALRARMSAFIDQNPHLEQKRAMLEPLTINIDPKGYVNKFDLAKAHYAVGNYAEARTLFSQELAAGNVAAYRYLGLLWLKGALIDRSPEKAFNYFACLAARKVEANVAQNTQEVERMEKELSAVRADLGYLEAQLVRVQEALFTYERFETTETARNFLYELEKAYNYAPRYTDPLRKYLLFSSGIAQKIQECLKKRQDLTVVLALTQLYASRITQCGLPSAHYCEAAVAPLAILEGIFSANLVENKGKNNVLGLANSQLWQDALTALVQLQEYAHKEKLEQAGDFTRLLGLCHVIGSLNGQASASLEKGISLLQERSSQEDLTSMYLLSLVLWYTGSTAKQRQSAIEILRKAANKGHQHAIITLGGLLSEPRATAAHVKEAESMYLARTAGDVKGVLKDLVDVAAAQYALGCLYNRHARYFPDGLKKAKQMFDMIIQQKANAYFLHGALLFKNKLALENPTDKDYALSEQEIITNFERVFMYSRKPDKRAFFMTVAKETELASLVGRWRKSCSEKYKNDPKKLAPISYVAGLYNLLFSRSALEPRVRVITREEAIKELTFVVENGENPINAHALLAEMYFDNEWLASYDYVKVQQHILKAYSILGKRGESIDSYELLNQISNQFKIALLTQETPFAVQALKVLRAAEEKYNVHTSPVSASSSVSSAVEESLSSLPSSASVPTVVASSTSATEVHSTASASSIIFQRLDSRVEEILNGQGYEEIHARGVCNPQ